MAITATILMLVALVISGIEWVRKTPLSKNWYRVYVTIVTTIVILSLGTHEWFQVICWSIVLWITFGRLKVMGLDIWK